MQDALSTNAPHIRRVREHGMDFLFVARQVGNKALFDALDERYRRSEVEEWSVEADPENRILAHGYRIGRDVPLNKSNADVLVNVLEYWEIDKKGEQHMWVWVTSLEPTRVNAEQIMCAGRARWRAENSVFLTLKRQGYHFEHSFGHGKEHLQSVLASLMLLAMLIDQVQLGFCRVFQAVKERRERWSYLIERIRSTFELIPVSNWALLLSYVHSPNLITRPDAEPL